MLQLVRRSGPRSQGLTVAGAPQRARRLFRGGVRVWDRPTVAAGAAKMGADRSGVLFTAFGSGGAPSGRRIWGGWPVGDIRRRGDAGG